MPKPKVVIYTDGSKWVGHSTGGWCAILMFATPNGTKQTIVTGQVLEVTTNIRCELLAAINGLEKLKVPCEVELTSDLELLVNGINSWMWGWEKKGWRNTTGKVKNADLWKLLHALCQRHTVKAKWTRGHVGTEYNELADELAGKARLGELTNYTITRPM